MRRRIRFNHRLLPTSSYVSEETHQIGFDAPAWKTIDILRDPFIRSAPILQIAEI